METTETNPTAISQLANGFLPNLILFSTSGLFLCTALLKALYPADAVAIALAYGLSFSAIIAVVQLELLVAALLLSGWRPQLAILCAVALLGVFACFSLVIALAGRESCGCFGAIQVNPWITFVLDVALVCLLLSTQVRSSTNLPPTSKRVLFTTASYLLLATAAFGFMATHRPLSLDEHSMIDTSTGIVLLEPDKWVGKPFPLQDFLDPTLDFTTGESFVLLYHHDCPTCQAALKQYRSFAGETEKGPAAQVVVIELPPYGPPRSHLPATSARLTDKVEWFVQTPVEIRLSQSRVVRVGSDLLPEK